MGGVNLCNECKKRFHVANADADGDVGRGVVYCALCFGLLGSSQIEKYTGAVMQAVHQSGHSLSTFNLVMALPGGIVSRDRLMNMECKDKGECKADGAEGKKPLYIRDVLKHALISSLQDAFAVESKSVRFCDDSDVEFRLTWDHEESEAELASALGDLLEIKTGYRRKRRKSMGVGVGIVTRVLAGLSDAEITQRFSFSPSTLCSFRRSARLFDVSVVRNTQLYIAGRYMKYSRELSQSPWFLQPGNRGKDEEMERKGDGSVEECIIGPLEAEAESDVCFPIKVDEWKFHAAGREDIDVRMMGTGRPFILRGTNPRSLPSFKPSGEECGRVMKEIQLRSGGCVVVSGLSIVSPDKWDRLIKGESEKRKYYRAVLWIEERLTDERIELMNAETEASVPFKIYQKTPVRVLHRRALAQRERTIYKLSIERISTSTHFYILDMVCQAGTYVKEFVSSDFGRTCPSVGSLLSVKCPSTGVKILQLDVTNVEFDL